MAVERVRGGERPSSVVTSFGFHRTTIYKWLKAASRPGVGLKALHARPATGRPRSLTLGQEQQVFRWINGRDPRQYGLDFGLWTRSVVADLIERKFNIRLGVTAGRSPTDYPPLRTPPPQISFFFVPIPCTARPGARRVRHLWSNGLVSGNRSARPRRCIPRRGAFWYCTYHGGLTAELFVTLLRRMMRRRSKPVHLVVDGLPAHKTALVKAYVASTKGMLTLHFLPGYAPELNPDELVWSHMKRTGVARAPLRRGEKLQEKIEAQLSAIKRMPRLIRSFFKAPSVSYITDW